MQAEQPAAKGNEGQPNPEFLIDSSDPLREKEKREVNQNQRFKANTDK